MTVRSAAMETVEIHLFPVNTSQFLEAFRSAILISKTFLDPDEASDL